MFRAAAFGAAAPFSEKLLMDSLRQMTRRNVVRGIAASAASLTLRCPAFAQSAARVVVIGGGFCGARCARAPKRVDPELEVTLIEPNPTFFGRPLSHAGIAGLPGIAGPPF